MVQRDCSGKWTQLKTVYICSVLTSSLRLDLENRGPPEPN